MDNFKEVSNCDKSTGLEYFSNDISTKKNITYEIEFRNSIQDWVFYHRFLVVKMLIISPA